MTETDSIPKLFVATHPRSTSTAFERSFLTRQDVLSIHEPFGDAFYFGPERMSDRFSADECSDSPFARTTFADVVADIEAGKSNFIQSCRQNDIKPSAIFIKDMAQYIIPPQSSDGHQGEVSIAPSLAKSSLLDVNNSNLPANLPPNPTVIPANTLLHNISYVILIRSPHLSVPSYYRCCIPPRSEETGFDHYRSSEAGYRELRILYDYLVKVLPEDSKPLVVDSADLCHDPETIVKAVCAYSKIPFDKDMMTWGKNSRREVEIFSKWKGFHDDALNSSGFGSGTTSCKPTKDFKTDFETWRKDWTEKYGLEGARIIEESVEEHLGDYLYLRQHKLCI